MHADNLPPELSDLTEEERKQLLDVMNRAKEFEVQEEKHLMRQPLEGLLYKYTNVVKGFQYRWFVLDPDMGRLDYFEKEENKKHRPRGFVHLAGCVICPSDEDSQTFLLNAADGEVYRLKANDARERQYWVNRLRATAEYQTATLAPNIVPQTQREAHSQFYGGRMKCDSAENIYSSASLPTHRATTTTGVKKRPGDTAKTVTVPHVSRDFVPVNVKRVQLDELLAPTVTQEDSFQSVRETLARLQRQQNDLVSDIESLPSSGCNITNIDEEMLLLKATSNATLGCLQDCLSILQHRKRASCEAEASLGSARDWFHPQDGSNTNVLSSSPTESFVSVTSSLQDDTSEGQAMVDHNAELEDPHEYMDTDLAGVEEHKGIILHLLSQLKRGMDLTKVVLPTFILEKRSLLELFADCMAHPDLFVSIPEKSDPEQRMLAVLEWYLTSFHVSRKGSIAKKPYNPVIGETFRCSWNVPVAHPGCHGDDGSQSDTTVGDTPTTATTTKLVYCAEQVSHHPPISAFYCECAEKSMYLNASIWTKSQFMGMSIGVMMIGKLNLHLLTHSEDYELGLPSAYARSILTVPWVELGDRVNIHCRQSGYSASVVFQTKPFYGGKLHRITSEVRNPAGEVIFKVTGEWNGVLEFSYVNGETRQMDTSRLHTVRKRVLPLSAQGSFESRRLWQRVTEKLNCGDLEGATRDKRFLEERQRRGEKHRKETGTEFQTKYFHKEGDRWVFNRLLQPEQKDTSI